MILEMFVGIAVVVISCFVIKLVLFIKKEVGERNDGNKIYDYLVGRAEKEHNNDPVPTERIHSSVNLSLDRVRYICSSHEKIASAGKDVWLLENWDSKGRIVRKYGLG